MNKKQLREDIFSKLQSLHQKHWNKASKNISKCEKCGKKKIKGKIFPVYSEYDPLDVVQHQLHKLTKRELTRLKSTDHLNKYIKIWERAPVVALCKKCKRSVRNQLAINHVFSSKSPKPNRKGSLKSILKSGPESSVKKVFQKITPLLKRKSLSPEDPRIWVCKTLRKYNKYFDKWPVIEEVFDSWHSILLKNPEPPNQIQSYVLCLLFFAIKPSRNRSAYLAFLSASEDQSYQAFLRFVQSYQARDIKPEQYKFFCYCYEEYQETQTGKIFIDTCLLRGSWGLFDQVLCNWVRFPPPLQSYAFESVRQIHSLDHLEHALILFNKLKDFNIPEKGSAVDLQYAKTRHYCDGQVKKLSELQKRRENETQSTEQAVSEIGEANLLPSKNFDSHLERNLFDKYIPLTLDHLKAHKEILTAYYEKNDVPLVAFDIEEWKNRAICIMGIQVRKDRGYSVRVTAIKNLNDLNSGSRDLFYRFGKWLKKIQKGVAITHGRNWREEQLVKRGGHTIQNTNDTVAHRRNTEYIFMKKIRGESIQDFEKYIGFKRKACGFFKHDLPRQVLFHGMLLSYRNHVLEMNQKVCEVCGKPQDVLLYCLEDAISTLLLHAWLYVSDQ